MSSKHLCHLLFFFLCKVQQVSGSEPSPGYSFQLEFNTLIWVSIMYFYDFVLFMASDTGFPFMAMV